MRVRRRRLWVAGGVGAAALAAAVAVGVGWPRAAAAKQGIVTNRQGQSFQGDVTEDDKFYFVDAPGGQLRVDKRNVMKVDYAAGVDDQFDKRHGKLAAGDVKGRIDLSQWANDHNRPDLAVSVLEEARQLDKTNRDVALALDAVQRQIDLDRRQGRPAAAAAGARPTAVAATQPAAATTAPAVTGGSAVERRLLTANEMNLVRQVEMGPDERGIRVRLDNNVARKYVAASGANAADFSHLSGEEQGLEILKYGDPVMAKDVRILTDPAALVQFRQKVLPIVVQACGSATCHGGKNAGNFGLYPSDSPAGVYTNFYILLTYSAQIGGVKYIAMDRESPERSLVLQFGLPPAQGHPPHPVVPGLRRVESPADPAYVTVEDWMTKALRVIQPEYGFNVSPQLLLTSPPVPGPTPGPTTAASRPTTKTAGATGEPAPAGP